MFLTKQQLVASLSVVIASWKSQYKSSLRHYMKVYTLQQEEKETEKNITTTTARDSISLVYISQPDK